MSTPQWAFDNRSNNLISMSTDSNSPIISVSSDGRINIGNDIEMSLNEFKVCMRTLIMISREKYPEEFL